MPDDLGLLRQRVIGILRSAPCQKVDFWLGGLHVNGAGFTLIAHAIERAGTGGKGIGVVIQPPAKDTFASYDSAANNLVLPRPDWAKDDRFEQLGTVHECTHALRDSQGRTLTYAGRPYRPRAATDEAAAYVAGCLYDVHVQQEGGKAPAARPAWLDSRVMSPANAIAYGMALRLAGKPAGSTVDRQDLSTLFKAVVAYRLETLGDRVRYYRYDGIPR